MEHVEHGTNRGSRQRVVNRYADDNLTAATIIAANPEKYPLGGLMQEWADVILSRAVDPQEGKAGLLFEAVA